MQPSEFIQRIPVDLADVGSGDAKLAKALKKGFTVVGCAFDPRAQHTHIDRVQGTIWYTLVHKKDFKQWVKETTPAD